MSIRKTNKKLVEEAMKKEREVRKRFPANPVLIDENINKAFFPSINLEHEREIITIRIDEKLRSSTIEFHENLSVYEIKQYIKRSIDSYDSREKYIAAALFSYLNEKHLSYSPELIIDLFRLSYELDDIVSSKANHVLEEKSQKIKTAINKNLSYFIKYIELRHDSYEYKDRRLSASLFNYLEKQHIDEDLKRILVLLSLDSDHDVFPIAKDALRKHSLDIQDIINENLDFFKNYIKRNYKSTHTLKKFISASLFNYLEKQHIDEDLKRILVLLSLDLYNDISSRAENALRKHSLDIQDIINENLSYFINYIKRNYNSENEDEVYISASIFNYLEEQHLDEDLKRILVLLHAIHEERITLEVESALTKYSFSLESIISENHDFFKNYIKQNHISGSRQERYFSLSLFKMLYQKDLSSSPEFITCLLRMAVDSDKRVASEAKKAIDGNLDRWGEIESVINENSSYFIDFIKRKYKSKEWENRYVSAYLLYFLEERYINEELEEILFSLYLDERKEVSSKAKKVFRIEKIEEIKDKSIASLKGYIKQNYKSENEDKKALANFFLLYLNKNNLL